MTVDREAASIGRVLREARERRGLTLRQVAVSTKISVGVLEAVERDDISRLPGGIFSRAFVRAYAREVGLDPERVIRDFIAQHPIESVTAGHPAARPPVDREAAESEEKVAWTIGRLILVSILVAALVFYVGGVLIRGTDEDPPQNEHALQVEQPWVVSPAAGEPC